MKLVRAIFSSAASLLLGLLLAVSSPITLTPIAHAAPTISNKVDPRVMSALAQSGRAEVILVLREQADLSGVARLATKREKGAFVFHELRAVAERTQPAVRDHLDRLGLSYRSYYLVNMFAVEGATPDAVQQLAARGEVARIEADPEVRLQPPLPSREAEGLLRAAGGIEWGVAKIGAPRVWAMGFRGNGIVYANSDTGVQWNHPALKTHYRGWNGSRVNHNYNWWDAIHGEISGNGANPCGYNLRYPCDDYGHGTHTLGTGVGDDGAGNRIGVAPAAKWIACRNMENGVGRPSRYAECFQFFLAPWTLNRTNANPDKAPDVVSNSWGCPLGSPPAGELCTPDSLRQAVTNLRAAGIFVTASAGNSGPSCSTIDAPLGMHDPATTVGATDSSDALASFSSRGPITVDGSNRRKPDLSAPGVAVRSSSPWNNYVTLSGTSMAAPHLAGAVALLWNARPKLRGAVSWTENVLFGTAYRAVSAGDTCGGTTSANIPNNLFGWGRVDVYSAVRSIQP